MRDLCVSSHVDPSRYEWELPSDVTHTSSSGVTKVISVAMQANSSFSLPSRCHVTRGEIFPAMMYISFYAAKKTLMGTIFYLYIHKETSVI
jgi:hypothetical protein